MNDYVIPMLDGRLVRLEPIRLEHASALLPSASDPEVWNWKLVARPTSVDQLEEIIRTNLIGIGTPTRQPFVVIRRSDGAVIGSTTVYNLDIRENRAEIGWTWFDRSCWGQGYNEDSKRLLLKYCFETLNLERVAWGADSENRRSINALRRLGFVYEGTLRSFQVRPDGSRRDTVYFSLLAAEWPAAQQHLDELIKARGGPEGDVDARESR